MMDCTRNSTVAMVSEAILAAKVKLELTRFSRGVGGAFRNRADFCDFRKKRGFIATVEIGNHAVVSQDFHLIGGVNHAEKTIVGFFARVIFVVLAAPITGAASGFGAMVAVGNVEFVDAGKNLGNFVGAVRWNDPKLMAYAVSRRDVDEAWVCGDLGHEGV